MVWQISVLSTTRERLPYQLTVMGQFAQAIVARKIADNRFVIRTSRPHVEVSWQVTRIRQDRWANAHRIPNEEQKPADERGMYLYPELYGAGADKRIGAMDAPAAPIQVQPGEAQPELAARMMSAAPQ